MSLKKRELARELAKPLRAHHLPSPKALDPRGHQLEEQAHRPHSRLHQVLSCVWKLPLRLADGREQRTRLLLETATDHLRRDRPAVRHRLVVVAAAAPHPALPPPPQLDPF